MLVPMWTSPASTSSRSRDAKLGAHASGCTVGMMCPTKPLGVGFVGAKIIEKTNASYALPAKRVNRQAAQGEEEAVMVLPLRLHMLWVEKLVQQLSSLVQALASKR